MIKKTFFYTCCLVLLLCCCACAPVNAYDVAVHENANPDNADIAVEWMNKEIECNKYTIVESTSKDWRGLFPKRGRITIEVKPGRINPGKAGRGRHSLRCGARGRVFLIDHDTSPAVIAHELGHIACLGHEPDTFMTGKGLTGIFRQDDGELIGPVMSPSQKAKLKHQCEDMQDERIQAEQETQ